MKKTLEKGKKGVSHVNLTYENVFIFGSIPFPSMCSG